MLCCEEINVIAAYIVGQKSNNLLSKKYFGGQFRLSYE